MAEITLAVGDGVEMRLTGATSVEFIVEGPLIAETAASRIVIGCKGRCRKGVVAFAEDNPEEPLFDWQPLPDNPDKCSATVSPGQVVRFHIALVITLIGDPGTEAIFSLPGEASSTVVLPEDS
jgi:hypothetical protein